MKAVEFIKKNPHVKIIEKIVRDEQGLFTVYYYRDGNTQNNVTKAEWEALKPKVLVERFVDNGLNLDKLKYDEVPKLKLDDTLYKVYKYMDETFKKVKRDN